MKKRVTVLILSVAILLLGLLLYVDSLNTLSTDQASDQKIVLITKMQYGDYWKTVLEGAQAAAKEQNVELIFDAPEDESDVEDQIDLVNLYIDEGVSGIVLAASDYLDLVSVVERASSLGVPLVLIDSNVNTTAYKYSYSTDNYQAGVQAGQALINRLGTSGKVGIISFVKGSENAIKREAGLMSVLNQFKGIEVLSTKYCISSIELAETHGMVFIDEGADAIIGLNAIASTGLGRALVGEDDVIGIGFDNTEEEIEYLDQGILDATIVQNPYAMGYLGVKNVLVNDSKLLQEKDFWIDTVVITPDNMFQRENQKLVFPFNAD